MAHGLNVNPIEITRDDLNNRVTKLRSYLEKRDPRFHQASQDLYQLLLSPVGEQVKGKKHIVVMPDCALWNIPFATLKSPNDRYLIESHPISLAPSFNLIHKFRNRKPRTSINVDTVLALGGNVQVAHETAKQLATLRSGTLGQLPQAVNELNQLGKLYGEQKSKVYLNDAAGERRFKSEAKHYGTVHLATHVVLNNSNPLYSYVLHARDSKDEDGLLEAWELIDLDLLADLAVLSDCETADTARPGEGMIGLTWALFVAGCPASVTSLWKVEDNATKELMVAFHRHLAKSERKDSIGPKHYGKLNFGCSRTQS